MKRLKTPSISQALTTFAALILLCSITRAQAPAEKSIDAPDGVRVSIKMIGPVTQTTDLQVLCILKHDPAGDKYIEAMKDFNDKLGGLLANLRERGEFIGDSGETLLFTPPANSIKPAKVLFIGVGDEAHLSLDELRLAGRIAAREAVRLNAAHVSFAPTLRDQGSNRIDVGDGDAAVAEDFLLAYDSEKRLQSQGLSPDASLDDFTIEAGAKYFQGSVDKVTVAIQAAQQQIKLRLATPYFVAASGK